MRFVVTGCARSGTEYLSRLLTLAGVNCGHEGVFNRWGGHGQLAWDGACDFEADSSFIAAPFDLSIPVAHLIRSPLNVIRSIVGIGWLDESALPYVQFVSSHTPRVLDEPPGPRRAARFWIDWNDLVSGDVVWRLHDLDLDSIARFTRADPQRLAEAHRKVSRSTNHRTRAEVAMDDLGPLAPRIADEADRYDVPLEVS